ncbi:MAG: hypothetical protein RBU21_23565, partial [FCB group bacterium]|nr:hypothetical protein [FCB group bacterium]
RRARRAFRFFVVATVLFTLMLAYAELYLQQDGAERLYTHALTLQDESSRVLLKQAVLQDRQTEEVPTPKYLQALAAREETERIRPTYEEAFALDKTNPNLAIRFGCFLLKDGKSREAAEKFTVAAENDPSNALPLYLKAIAQHGAYESSEGLSESLALIAQANTSGQLVSFPRPLWSSFLPNRGRVYAGLCRRVVDECSAPIYSYVNAVIGQARTDIEARRTQYWDAWLQTLQVMGERVALSAIAPEGEDSGTRGAGSALQAQLGFRIQLAAIEQRLAIVQTGGAPPNDELAARKGELEAALRTLQDFENGRDERIARDREGYLLSARLFALALLGTFAAYLVARMLWNRWGRRIVAATLDAAEAEGTVKSSLAEAGKEAERTIRHTAVAKTVLVAGAGLLLLTLFVLMGLQSSRSEDTGWMSTLTTVWVGELFGLLAFGLVYPYLSLPAAERAAVNHGGSLEHGEEMVRRARLYRRRAALCLSYRYYGILLGLVLVVFAFWTVGYRVAIELYPWQTPLLTTGLIDEETAATKAAIRQFR